MSSETPPKPPGIFANPQVITAIIGGTVTLLAAIVGVLPNLVKQPEATITPIVVTATPAQLVEATIPPQPAAPTLTPLLPSNPTIQPASNQAPNLLLLYDDVSFTVLNQSGADFSLEGVTFSSSGGFWDAQKWGPAVYNSLPNRNCLRLRDSAAGQRQPPAQCENLYGLQLVGATALFWINVTTFDVLVNNSVIATCTVADGSCPIAIP